MSHWSRTRSSRLAALAASVVVALLGASAPLARAAGEQQTVDEARALGKAQANRQNAALKDGTATTAVSTTVPGYTAAPPQATYYSTRDLTTPAQQQQAECMASPNNPTCAGIAAATANRPQQNVTSGDPALRGAAVGRNPSLIFGDIAATYNACSVGGHPVSPDGFAYPSCSLDTGPWTTHACEKALFAETKTKYSCEPGSQAHSARIYKGGNIEDYIEVVVQCQPYTGGIIRIGISPHGKYGACSDVVWADLDMSRPQTLGPQGVLGMVSPMWDGNCRFMQIIWEGPGCQDKQCQFKLHFATGAQFIPVLQDGVVTSYTLSAIEDRIVHMAFTQPHLMSVPGDTLLNTCAPYESVTSNLQADGIGSVERPVFPTIRGLEAPQCVRTSSVCTVGAGTKIIDGVPVTKECWKFANTFECTTLVKPSTCAEPVYKNCETSRTPVCLRDDGAGHCLQANAQLACNGGGATFTPAINCGNQSYCAGGSCWDTSYEPNKDFNQAVSQMEARAEAGDTLDEKGTTVFTGKDNRCSRDRYGFSNCCGGSSVTQCSDAEKKTVELRDAGKCASAGDYCSRKNIFGCYETTESYCCFGSLLARIVQEQGRSQLGRSFGDPKNPDCSGLTIAELTAIDWSKIDFTEFYATITPEDPKASDAKGAVNDKQQSCYWGNGRC